MDLQEYLTTRKNREKRVDSFIGIHSFEPRGVDYCFEVLIIFLVDYFKNPLCWIVGLLTFIMHIHIIYYYIKYYIYTIYLLFFTIYALYMAISNCLCVKLNAIFVGV